MAVLHKSVGLESDIVTSSTGAAVYIVDDDEAVRDSLCHLFSSVSMHVETFPSGEAFLAFYDSEALEYSVGCVFTDLRMPGMSAFDVQAALTERNSALSMIFITGHGDVETGVRAMKAGAMDFIEKPFKEQSLLEMAQKGIVDSARKSDAVEAVRKTREKFDLLTPRERDVLTEIVSGEPNKRIAHTLGLSEKTVEFHRSNLMKKMEARSLADLIRKALSVTPT